MTLCLLVFGVAMHVTIFTVRNYDPSTRYNNLLDRVLSYRDAIISHLTGYVYF